MLAVAVHHVIIVRAVCLMAVDPMSHGAGSDLVPMTVIVMLVATMVMVLMALGGGRGGSGGSWLLQSFCVFCSAHVRSIPRRSYGAGVERL
jgi:hypothetical protein